MATRATLAGQQSPASIVRGSITSAIARTKGHIARAARVATIRGEEMERVTVAVAVVVVEVAEVDMAAEVFQQAT